VPDRKLGSTKEHNLANWKSFIVWLALGLLIGCGNKGTPPPTATLVPTLALPEAVTVTATTVVPTSIPATETPLPPSTPTEVPLAALVNGQPILLADFEREVARAGDAATGREVLDAMIETLLLEQAAVSAGITIADDQLDEIIQTDIDNVGGREVFEARLAANNMTEEEYREQVRANLLAQRVQVQLPGELPDAVEHVHARHILVATQEDAEAILAQLRDGGDFALLAQTFSLDVSTREQGGDLGFFPRGLLLAPELEDAAFSLAPGEISDVVHSELLGYHVVQVLEREERPVGEQEVELIRASQVRRWREQLWADASIERFIEP
jgi:parvulin-like peptidyl-prolyl isomerase